MWELLNLKSLTQRSEKLLKFDFPRGITFERLFRVPGLTFKNIIPFYSGRAEPETFQEFIIN